MGHDTGRPAPAASTSDPNVAPAATSDSRWAELAATRATQARDEALACPSCGASLTGAEAFETDRVCPRCDRHFPFPALERLHRLVDAGTFEETSGVLVSVDPLIFRDLLPFPEKAEQIRERSGPGGGLGEAVITGTGEIGGRAAVLLVLDHSYLGGNIGPVAAEKVVLAMELALARRLPLIALCAASYPGFPSGDESRMQTGMLSLAQWPKIAAAAARLHSAAIPIISVLAHPTSGGIYAGLGCQADVILAEPGAQIGLHASGRGYPAAELTTAEDLLAQGQIDAVVERRRARATIATLLGLFADRGGFVPAPAGEPAPPVAQPPFWEQMALAAHPARPSGRDLAVRLTDELVVLHGDRVDADASGITCGLGRLAGRPVAIIAQERLVAPATPSPVSEAAGWRQALRLLRLAGHFELPVVTLIDDGAAAPGAGAERAGTGLAIAEVLRLSSLLPVPIVSVILGQGHGLGAIALSAGDRRLMLQHAILLAEPARGVQSRPDQLATYPTAVLAGTHPLTAQECLRLGLADIVVTEPAPGAHADPELAAQLLGQALSRTLAELNGIGSRRLLEERGRRLRSLGESTPEGREAARREIRELQELQRTLSRSLDGLRGRWEGRPRSLPRLPRPTLPSVASLPRPGQLDPGRLGTRVRPELADLAGRIADGVRARGQSGRDLSSLDEEPPAPPRPDSLN